MALESMTLNMYKRDVDANFIKKEVTKPSRLSEEYFDNSGEPTKLLERITLDVGGVVDKLGLNKEVSELYIFGTHTKGTFWEGSDLDIGILMSCDQELQRQLYDELNEEIRGKYPARQGDEAKPGHTIYPVHLHLHLVKPHGNVYDLMENKWVTFGKTEGDHHDYEWQVLGLRVD